MSQPIMAIGPWKTNAELIADAAKLGYLKGHVCDLTYGKGRFWAAFRPERLTACDLNVDKSPIGRSIDFRATPWNDGEFDSVVFDPPYRLSGTPDQPSDADYGIDVTMRWQDRMQQIQDGLIEAIRITAIGGYTLLKCQDQVCSGKVRWQTVEFAIVGENAGTELHDMFHLQSYRKQPAGRSQLHARRNYSSLLIFKKV